MEDIKLFSLLISPSATIKVAMKKLDETAEKILLLWMQIGNCSGHLQMGISGGDCSQPQI